MQNTRFSHRTGQPASKVQWCPVLRGRNRSASGRLLISVAEPAQPLFPATLAKLPCRAGALPIPSPYSRWSRQFPRWKWLRTSTFPASDAGHHPQFSTASAYASAVYSSRCRAKAVLKQPAIPFASVTCALRISKESWPIPSLAAIVHSAGVLSPDGPYKRCKHSLARFNSDEDVSSSTKNPAPHKSLIL
jgi:hypothetical protein